MIVFGKKGVCRIEIWGSQKNLLCILWKTGWVSIWD